MKDLKSHSVPPFFFVLIDITLTCSCKVSYSLPGMTELQAAHSFITAMTNIPLCLEKETEKKNVSKKKKQKQNKGEKNWKYWDWFIFKLSFFFSYLSLSW